MNTFTYKHYIASKHKDDLRNYMPREQQLILKTTNSLIQDWIKNHRKERENISDVSGFFWEAINQLEKEMEI